VAVVRPGRVAVTAAVSAVSAVAAKVPVHLAGRWGVGIYRHAPVPRIRDRSGLLLVPVCHRIQNTRR
jgi:hypothetical protein